MENKKTELGGTGARGIELITQVFSTGGCEEFTEYQLNDKLQFLKGCVLKKLSEPHKVHFVILQGDRVTGFVLSKCKPFTSERFKNASLSLETWVELHGLMSATRQPLFLFFNYTDVSTFIKIDGMTPTETANRNGKLVVYIPVSIFERI